MPYGRYKNKIGPNRGPSLTTKYKAQVRAAKLYASQALQRKAAAIARKAANARAAVVYHQLISKPRNVRSGSITF